MIFLKDFCSVKTSSFSMHARTNATVKTKLMLKVKEINYGCLNFVIHYLPACL